MRYFLHRFVVAGFVLAAVSFSLAATTDRAWEMPPGWTETRGGAGARDVSVDRCSLTWATDENLSASGPRWYLPRRARGLGNVMRLTAD